jgi:hypothetical protein
MYNRYVVAAVILTSTDINLKQFIHICSFKGVLRASIIQTFDLNIITNIMDM